MTRDEHRAKCIGAMYRRARHHSAVMWHSDVACKEAMADILDSLHGIAFVDPIEATEEMRTAAAPYFCGSCKAYKTDEEAWRAMAAAGDITTPPEKKP